MSHAALALLASALSLAVPIHPPAAAVDVRAVAHALARPAHDLVRAEGELGESWIAPNPRRGMRTRFDARGIAIEPASADWRFALELQGFGRAGDVRLAGEAELAVAGARAEYRRAALVEWYVNDERGLEQGFTIAAPPACNGPDRPLELRLTLDTDLCPEPSADARALRFRDAHGEVALHYAGLAAWDAHGRDLEASLCVEERELAIRVDDTDAVYPVTVDPLCYVEQAKLTASDAAALDSLGMSVALSGGTALAGAPFDDDQGTSSGAAYVFVQNGSSWAQQAKLVAGDGAAFDFFGGAVALDGDTVLVGAREDDDSGADSGSAYVFVRSGTSWSLEAKLVAADAAAGDRFGSAVALHGDTALVGAPGKDVLFTDTGAAYVFVRNGTSWSQQVRLTPPGLFEEANYGSEVALSGETALVGAPTRSYAGLDEAGTAYVSVRSGTTWTHEAVLLPSDAANDERFGSAVAVEGDLALVGAVWDTTGGLQTGAAYVFVRAGTSWSQQAKLAAGDAPGDAGPAGDEFGCSVALNGELAFVGERFELQGGAQGAVHAFARQGSSWAKRGRIAASDGGGADWFGHSLSASGACALVGAPMHHGGAPDTGAAYVFEFPAETGAPYCFCDAGPCGNSDPDAGCANATGHGALLTAQGSTLPDEVSLIVTGARPKMLAVFFQYDEAEHQPFGDGFRCATGGALPLTPFPGFARSDGTLAFGPCFGHPPISSITGVVPGSGVTKRYQLWYRDPGGPCGSGFNLSNGYEIVW